MAIKDALLPEFDHEVGTTRKVLDRIPDAQLGWKPHDKSTTIGGLGSHIANLPGLGSRVLGSDEFDVASATRPPQGNSRAEILSMFDAATKQFRDALASKSDAELMATWTLKRGGQTMFAVPRIGAIRTFMLNHLIHHRGQLSVYLRLLDVPVPSIYGPSADEPM